jgi:hypothetical protein
MNILKIKITHLITFSFVFFLAAGLQAQDDFGIGVNLGGGTLGGNMPTQGSFATSIFVEGNPGFSGNYLLRLTFVYNTDIDVLLPDATNRYFPFLKGFSLKGIQTQDFANSIYAEEGLGFIALNDRTYAGINEWDYGAAFSLLVGLDLRHGVQKGFKIGVGGEYGLTFNNNTVRYFSVFLQSVLFF